MMKRNIEPISAPLHMLLAAGLAAFLFYLSNTTLPVLSLFMVFPFVTLYLAEGIGWLLGGALLCGVGIATAVNMLGFSDGTMGVNLALSVVPQNVLMAAAMGEIIRRKRSTFEEFVTPALVFTLASVVYLVLQELTLDEGILERFREVSARTLDEMIALLREQGATEATVAQTEVIMRSVMDVMLAMTPSLFFIEGMITAAVSSGIARWFAHNTVSVEIEPLTFSTFYVTRPIALGLILATIVCALLGSWAPALRDVSYNLIAAALFLFFFHGLARVEGNLKRAGMGLLGRVLIAIVIVLFLFPTIFVTMYGIFKSIQIKQMPPRAVPSAAASDSAPTEEASDEGRGEGR